MISSTSGERARRFVRFRLRELLILIAVVGVFLAILAHRLQSTWSDRRRETANRDLVAAAEGGDFDRVLLALSAGADPNACDQKANTALSFAVKCDNQCMASCLLEAGADPNLLAGGKHLLFLALERGNPATVELLLSRGANPNAVQQVGSVTPAALILTGGANPANPAASPVLKAVIESPMAAPVKLRIVRELLDHGADPIPMMDFAVRRGEGPIADLLREHGAAYTLRDAAMLNRVEEVKRLVGANPALLHEQFGTPPTSILSAALRTGSRETAMFLLDAGAPVDALDEVHGASMLHAAASGGDPVLVKEIIARGVRVSVRDSLGDTPLHDAAMAGKAEIVATLLEAGADVNAKGRLDTTPLHSALQGKHPRLVAQLLAAGAEIAPEDVRFAKSQADLAKLLRDANPALQDEPGP